MDPVEKNNEIVDAKRAALAELLEGIEGVMSFHDFRMVTGPTHTNLIFDVVIPAGYKKTAEEMRKEITTAVEEKMPGHFAVVTVDTSFVN